MRLHELIESGHTPRPVYTKKCDSCSLEDVCLTQNSGEEKICKTVFIRSGEGIMKRHLNTLFVTTQGAYLAKEGETAVVKVEREVRLRVPIHTIGGIVCFGQVSISPFLMGFCAERDVAISFLSQHGRFFGKSSGAGLWKRPVAKRAISEGR